MQNLAASTAQDDNVRVRQGDSPLVLAFPHTGTFLPPEVEATLNDTGRALSDTDWHIDRLYDDLVPDATMVSACFHRYVIDANRDPSGVSLYPGQNTTTLVPLTDFDGRPIWTTPPTETETAARLAGYHAPYHLALSAELARVHARHGFVILYDCHSIRSEIPFLFDGRLPDFNIGTNGGTTCAPALADLVQHHCTTATEYRTVTNGRFRGGWTTRHYGRPEAGFHAIQMELAQACYMLETPPWTYDTERATRLRAVLGPMLRDIAALDLTDTTLTTE
ncbi:N-formylglutamate deformylase [Roseovarius sp.]|uniref:N-formylglutamate deformylase n=1 Tax=Roseovarius sp. TaxID=1486281 RepID=UPI003A97CFC3